MVYFVGAGPGAKDLITVRGMRLLEQADVIIYAGSLVNPELLSYAGSGAKIYDSAKMTLEEVLAVIREAEEKGLTTSYSADRSISSSTSISYSPSSFFKPIGRPPNVFH